MRACPLRCTGWPPSTTGAEPRSGPGVLVALGVSVGSLGLGARWLPTRLRLSPALLLRVG
jgi:hypothetical protein